MKNFLKRNSLFLILCLIFCVLFILYPDLCLDGAKRGLLISGDIIIPSLFPFSVCVLFIINLNIAVDLSILNRFTNKVFGHSFGVIITMFLSMLGGYPIGAKLIDGHLKRGEIDSKQASYMLAYCINAGPAFIIIAVGEGLLHSKYIGFILLFSHITASLIICAISGKILKKSITIKTKKSSKNINIIDNFVLSVADSADAMIRICSFIIVFSVFNSYLNAFSQELPLLKILSFISEVTSGVAVTKNIIVISFILGFSGLCICCQVLSLLNNCNVKLGVLLLYRAVHGGLSAFITLIILKIFSIPISAISNGINVKKMYTYGGVKITISLFIMILLLFITLFSKNHSGKKENNMV